MYCSNIACLHLILANTMNEQSTAYNILNGIIGAGASFLGVVTQFQEQLDWVLKTTSTSLLICVSLVTLYNLLKKKKS
jgi:multidrug transporter EmrE-like cation transporter